MLADSPTTELSGGARIYYIFDSIFRKGLMNIDPASNLSIQDVITAIRNSAGPRASIFVPEYAFDLLIKPQIKLLHEPSQRCVELVSEELFRICLASKDTEINQFPHLESRLVHVVSELLHETLTPTLQFVMSLIDIEVAYINTNHPDFIGGTAAVKRVMERQQNEQAMARKEETEYQDITSLECRNAEVEHGESNKLSRPDSRKTLIEEDLISNEANDQKKEKESFLAYFFGRDTSSKSPSEPCGLVKQVMENAELDKTLSQKLDEALLLNEEVGHPIGNKDRMDALLILSLISSYFDIVRKTIEDQVPKAIMHYMVNNIKQNLQSKLVAELYKEDLFDHLLAEDQDLKSERERCATMLSTYKEANRIIMNIL